VKLVVVFDIGVPAVAKLSRDDSHAVTLPVSPVKLRIAPLVPEQTVDEVAMDPPILVFTVMVTEDEFADGQLPFLMMAL
jgi:hypothetical protein